MDFPTFLLTLLSGDWVFFGDNDIAWDGEHHQITGIQVNGAQAEQFMSFVNTFASDFDDIEDVVNHLIGFMGEIEKDEDLRIPREAIAPGIRQAIREGDLTGITLMNLAACGAAFMVRQSEPNSYAVLFDTRLAMGIPAFFDLIARLLWDLRQYLRSLMGVPFKIVFASARNFDADQCLDDVSKPVFGAQANPQAMIIDSLPVIHFDGEKAAGEPEKDGDSACYTPFASGFDDPDEMQADEELFETAVNSLMREFPLTMPIEGTHVLGRAQRIESIKVGDSLVLAADWQSPYFTPVCIEVFNEKGETLGNLSGIHTFFMSGHRELALLLPYIKATVESVTPLSKRRKNAKYALMDVKLELDTSLLPESWSAAYEKHLEADDEDFWPQSAPWLSVGAEFMRKMVLLLAKPKDQRVTMSQSSLKPKQLEGNIDTSEALDDPYDLESGGNGSSDDDSEALQAPDVQPQAGQISGEGKADESEDERASAIAMLELFVLTGQLSGIEFSPELLDELERAKAGDESIDVDALAERLNSASPDSRTVDFSTISFAKGERAEGRRFSIAVPDGWTVLKDYEENNMLISKTRPFVAVPGEVDASENLSLSDRIIYSDLAGDLEVDDDRRMNMTPSMMWVLSLMASYNVQNLQIPGAQATLWDEEVEAENTRCLVTMAKMDEGADDHAHYEFHIRPYAMDHGDMIRVVFSSVDEASLESAKEMVLQIARSVRLDKPLVATCIQELDEACQKTVDPESFEQIAKNNLAPFMGGKDTVFTAAIKRRMNQGADADEKVLVLKGAKGLAELNARAIPVFSKVVDAYEKQVELGADEAAAQSMLAVLKKLDEATFATESSFEDADQAEIVKKSRVLNPSPDLLALRDRLQKLQGDIESERTHAAKTDAANQTQSSEHALKSSQPLQAPQPPKNQRAPKAPPAPRAPQASEPSQTQSDHEAKREDAQQKPSAGPNESAPQNEVTSTDPRVKRMRSEKYDVKSLKLIIAAMTHRITADGYTDLCEKLAIELIRRRRDAVEAEISRSASIVQNSKVAVRVFDETNPIIIRYANYLLDVIDAQIDLGADLPTIMKMILRADFFFRIATGEHSTGYKVINECAGSNPPYPAPAGLDDLHKRIKAIETRFNIESFPDGYAQVPSYMKGESMEIMSTRLPQALIDQALQHTRVTSGNSANSSSAKPSSSSDPEQKKWMEYGLTAIFVLFFFLFMSMCSGH